MSAPILTTQNFTLSPLKRSEFEELMVMYLEPDSNKYVRPLQNKSKEDYLALFERKLIQNQSETGHGFWVIRRSQNQEFVGTCNLNELHGTSWLQMGCHLRKEYWNKGVASEVCQRILEYGFDELGVAEIFGIFEPENSASRKLCTKLGFTFDRYDTFMDQKIELHLCKKK